MRTIPVAQCDLTVSELSLGCMRLDGLTPEAIDRLVATALDEGITFFDHADIYGGGRCESAFAAAVHRLGIPRDRLVLQSKCGIRPGRFDFSREHILASVEGILRRLGTDHLDVLLLHRPDTLVEPDEVAAAFTTLQRSGQVRWFGVSNSTPGQIALLQRSVTQKLVFNQLQFSLANTGMIDAGLNANMQNKPSVDHDGGILDYCRLHGITIQAWSPFQHGFFSGVFLDNPEFPALNAVMERIAAEHGVTKTAIAVAWISRHPARIQTILGTTNPQRLRDACRATTVVLSREDWYELYRAAGNILP